MLNLEMYAQMGYTTDQVLKAYEYSQKKKVDMFDALQQIQNGESAQKQRKLQAGVPANSYLNNMKNYKLNEYEVIYSRCGLKQNNFAKDELREPNTPVGLFNVSNCCYLNSLLQCYFLMGAFTREILEAEEMHQLPSQLMDSKRKIIKNQYLLLQALKQMFSKMKLSSRRYLDPTPVLKNLINSVGQKIQYGDEKDLNEINMEIVDRLSQCLMYTKKYYIKGEGSPSKTKKRQNIKHLFYGEKVEVIEGMEGESVVDFMGIILNPKHQSLFQALDSQFNYDVEVDGKLMKKSTFIRILPTYLFFTINLTQYEKKGNQLLKNSQKLAFDFEIYLDQYLEQNKEQIKLKNPQIKELQTRKNTIKNLLNHLDLMAQKLQQCRVHAKYLAGWQAKLPKNEQVESQKQSFRKEIEQIQQQLAAIQSRNQKYVLIYIFVHRGDAISGHYWGYGRNGGKWYRFDVNCTLINQSDILLDMQKSSGTPYALVYAKDDHIESFDYPYFLSDEAHPIILDMNEIKTSYTDFIPPKIRKAILNENIAMHSSIQKQKNKNIIKNVVKDYISRYNIVKSEIQKYISSHKNTQVPLYSNFACYLQSMGQSQFMKFNIFSTALLSKAELSCNELIHNDKLLKIIQNSFRKKIKGKMSLRHFAIECQPIQGAKYKQAVENYVAGKQCLEFIKIISQSLKSWPKVENLYNYLQDISQVLSSENNTIYLKNAVSELVAIILIDLVTKQIPIRSKWIQVSNKQNSLLQQQLKSLSFQQISEEEVKKLSKTSISQIGLEKTWNVENMKKNSEADTLKLIRDIMLKLEQGLTIYKVNVKQNKVVKEANGKEGHQPDQDKKKDEV